LQQIFNKKIRELNDVCRWPREYLGKSDQVLSRPKLWTKNRYWVRSVFSWTVRTLIIPPPSTAFHAPQKYITVSKNLI